MTEMWIGAIVALVAVIIVMYYNSLQKAKVKVEEAKSGIDVALSKRYNVLINLIETVKGYAKHEKEVLTKITEIRASMNINELSDVNDEYNKVQKQLLLVAESYPELKASESFLHLQTSIFDCEEHLQAARRFYNSNVSHLNTLILSFPTNLFANAMDIQKADFFEADDSEKDSVKVQI